MPERLECEVLQQERYINTLTFTFTFTFTYSVKTSIYEVHVPLSWKQSESLRLRLL